MVEIKKMKYRKYKCSKCGYEKEIQTNHTDVTISSGRYNVCPKCPPFRKYPEYNAYTSWICQEED